MTLMTLMTSDVRPAASIASHDATRRRRYLTATTLFTIAAHALTASAFSLAAAALTLAAAALGLATAAPGLAPTLARRPSQRLDLECMHWLRSHPKCMHGARTRGRGR